MNLANRITLARIISIPFFIIAVTYGKMGVALGIFLFAVLTDALDGFIARTWNQKTKLGTILDPVADKLLLTSAFIYLAMAPSIPIDVKLPAYVPIIVISRDVLIVIGSVIVYYVAQDLNVVPSILVKVTTFFQMLTIVSVLTSFHFAVS